MDTVGSGDVWEFVLASLAVVLVLVIVWYVLQVVAYWKIFKKAGEPGWKSIIPIYNDYIQYKVTWKSYFYWIFFATTVIGTVMSNYSGAAYVIALILLIASLVISIISNNKLAKAFGHGTGFTIGLIFLKPIFTLILGFGGDEYQGPQ